MKLIEQISVFNSIKTSNLYIKNTDKRINFNIDIEIELAEQKAQPESNKLFGVHSRPTVSIKFCSKRQSERLL